MAMTTTPLMTTIDDFRIARYTVITPMEYLLFALAVMLIAAFVFQSWQGTKERQQLALLIKSRDVQEFVRASTQLEAAQPVKDDEDSEDTSTDFDDLSPDDAARAISGGASTPTA